MEEYPKRQGLKPGVADVLAAVARGVTIVTPGGRTANWLSRQVDAEAVAQGNQSWRAARILPWTAWVGSLWESVLLHGIDTRVVLTRVQELALWESIILSETSVTEQSALVQAEVCVRATGLLGRYRASRPFSERSFAGSLSNDAALFRAWYLRFQEICTRSGFLSAALLETELSTLVRQQSVPTANEILLFGFSDVTPSRQELLDAFRECGSAVRNVNVSRDPSPTPEYLQYADAEAELQACVGWVRDRLNLAPQQTVGIVVPDLPSIRNELERELRRTISPGSANVVDTATAAYEFSSGQPLQSVPLIRDALVLLRWCAEPLPLEEVGLLLRSSHATLADSPESGASLALKVLSRQAPLRKEFTLRQASALLHPHPANQKLMDLYRQAAELRVTASYAHFTALSQALLQTSGWPGSSPLSGEERQAVEAWQRLLDAAASLDLFGKKTTWPAFLQCLQTELSSSELIPRYRGMPVQVTGVEEALGSPVDALWFLRAEASVWPSPAMLNPLLPLALQRDFGMPGTDSQQDEELAATRLHQLIGSTAEAVRISLSGDPEQDAGRPSPVAERVLSSLGVTLSTATDIKETVQPEPPLETFFDTIPLPALPAAEVSGGVSVLTAQAQCGFRAWAEKRLFSDPAEELKAGLSPQERGDQVHAILQKFWADTRSQQALRKMRMKVGADGLSERDRLLQACIAEVCTGSAAEAWDEAYLSVQKQRLFRLLTAWLDYEETRPPFEVLQLEQQSKDVSLGPLKLHMRVDRVDRVLAGSGEDDGDLGTLLIDYKTGNKGNSPREWSGSRPDQPQLPAYAVAAALSEDMGALNGIAFASVRAGTGNMRLKGLAEAGLLPPQRQKSELTFPTQKEEWRRHLEALAQAFADGIATVAPKTFPKTCDRCGQRLLCRLDAATLLGADTDAFDSTDPEAE